MTPKNAGSLRTLSPAVEPWWAKSSLGWVKISGPRLDRERPGWGWKESLSLEKRFLSQVREEGTLGTNNPKRGTHQARHISKQGPPASRPVGTALLVRHKEDFLGRVPDEVQNSIQYMLAVPLRC